MLPSSDEGPMNWLAGSITLEPVTVNEAPTYMDAAVCLDVPGMVLYQVAEGMAYAVPLSRVIEVTFTNDYPKGVNV